MKSPERRDPVCDFEPTVEQFRRDVLSDLQRTPKRLPCKYFYDERGSQLFDQICELDEYYLTRTELAIMEQHAGEMARQLGRRGMLIEFGSGSSIKTRLLLDQMQEGAYVPVDISREHLHRTATDLAARYPHLEVLPVCADFLEPFELPEPEKAVEKRVLYFPGSTIGNFEPHEARELLRQIAEMVGPGGGLLIGIDLKKDPQILESAYNDAAGVTADFNLNVLSRINRELGADFALDRFQHRAEYNEQAGRIEMYLISDADQQVTLKGQRIHFARGEKICTEYSHKYSVDQFREIARPAKLEVQQVWSDTRRLFAVMYLERAASSRPK